MALITLLACSLMVQLLVYLIPQHHICKRYQYHPGSLLRPLTEQNRWVCLNQGSCSIYNPRVKESENTVCIISHRFPHCLMINHPMFWTILCNVLLNNQFSVIRLFFIYIEWSLTAPVQCPLSGTVVYWCVQGMLCPLSLLRLEQAEFRHPFIVGSGIVSPVKFCVAFLSRLGD